MNNYTKSEIWREKWLSGDRIVSMRRTRRKEKYIERRIVVAWKGEKEHVEDSVRRTEALTSGEV